MTGDRYQLHQFTPKGIPLLTKQMNVALHQRDRPATVVGQSQAAQQFILIKKKIRIGAKIIGHPLPGEFAGLLAGRLFCHRVLLSRQDLVLLVRELLRRRGWGSPGRRSCPSNTVLAGPSIITGDPFPCHSITSRPPRSSTSTRVSNRPRSWPATTAAQAPLPQARVSPEPRSNTRKRAWPRSTICRNPILALEGNRGCFSSMGPRVATGAVSTSSTNSTPWGLPMETADNSTLWPSTSTVYTVF